MTCLRMSRLVIRLMARQKRAFTRLALLIADLGVTVTIFVVAFYLADLAG